MQQEAFSDANQASDLAAMRIAEPATSVTLRILLATARFLPYVGVLEMPIYEVGRRLVRAGADVIFSQPIQAISWF